MRAKMNATKVDKKVVAEEFKAAQEDKTLAAMYAKRRCKQCLGKGYYTRSWASHGHEVEREKTCACVKAGIEKAMAEV
jgi:hypothetical protein